MVTEQKQSLMKFVKSFLFWFALFWLLSQAYLYFMGEDTAATPEVAGSLVITPVQGSFVQGQLVSFTAENISGEVFDFASVCSVGGFIDLVRVVNEKPVSVSEGLELCNETLQSFVIDPGQSADLAFPKYNTEIFSERGEYALRLKNGEEELISTPVAVTTPGVFRQLFRAVISKPLFNIMIWFTQTIPGASFGVAIILLTLLVRLILFFPSLKSIRSQKALQAIQPKLEALKKEYKDNQQMLGVKTMELYKTHNVNPFASCLPVLLQLPFLLGVYFIVREGVSPHVQYLLFDVQKDVNLAGIDTMFFGLDLSVAQISALPFFVAALQFVALWLSLGQSAGKDGAASQSQQMNKVMLWVMPLMIGFFAATLPSGVGLYWLTSTFFGILQTFMVKSDFGTGKVRKKVS